MKLCIRAHDLGTMGTDGIIKRIKELELDGIQLVVYKVYEDVPYNPGAITREKAVEIGKAMKEAGVEAADIDYVNAHGTGTPMNDVIETVAIKKALGEVNAKNAYVSSTKSMTGHMLGAAGAIEALACLFALNEGVIPPTINLKEQDEACDLNCVPNTAVNADITLALSNSLGFGGHNACLAFRKV